MLVNVLLIIVAEVFSSRKTPPPERRFETVEFRIERVPPPAM